MLVWWLRLRPPAADGIINQRWGGEYTRPRGGHPMLKSMLAAGMVAGGLFAFSPTANAAVVSPVGLGGCGRAGRAISLRFGAVDIVASEAAISADTIHGGRHFGTEVSDGIGSHMAVAIGVVTGITGAAVGRFSGALRLLSATAPIAPGTTAQAAAGCGVSIGSPGAGIGTGVGRTAATTDEGRKGSTWGSAAVPAFTFCPRPAQKNAPGEPGASLRSRTCLKSGRNRLVCAQR